MRELLEAVKNRIEDNVTVKGVRVKKEFCFVNPEFDSAKVKASKKKTEDIVSDRFVFASFVCEYEFREDKFSSHSEFLGIFTDPEKAEKACDDFCTMQWTPINSIPTVDNKYVYKTKGEFLIDDEFMVLTIRSRIVLMVEIDKFNVEADLACCYYVDQPEYTKILELFRTYRDENNKSLFKLRNGIHKLFRALEDNVAE